MQRVKLHFWKAIPGFPDYFASNTGLIMSTKTGESVVKKFYQTKDGYVTVGLTPEGRKEQIRYRVHVIIAKTWLTNSDGHKVVNHINGIKNDNRVVNLEWISQSDNIKHARSTGLMKTYKRPVCQADKDGNLIAEFESMTAAAQKLGIKLSSISAVCQGKRRFVNGYTWYYKDKFKGQKVRKFGNCKTVLQYDRNGKFIREFESVNEASVKMKCHPATIADACRGKQNTCKGFVWKYAEKEVKKDVSNGWKKVEGFSSYKISTNGGIYSIISKKLLTSYSSLSGRRSITLVNDQGEQKKMYIHRLVALAYLPNPNNYPVINHIDGNPANNKVGNLEWCTYAQNSQHAYDTGINKNKTAVVQFTLEGEEIARFDSTKDAGSAIGVNRTAISYALKDFSRSSGGFRWKRVKDL